MEPVRLRKLLGQVCDAIASSILLSLIMLVGSPRWHHKSFGAIALDNLTISANITD